MSPIEAEALILQLFDGDIGPEELARLEKAIANSPALQEVYREHAILHSYLESQAHVISPTGEQPAVVVPVKRTIQQRRRRDLISAIVATVGIAILLGMILQLIHITGPNTYTSLQSTPDSIISIRSSGDQESKETSELSIGSSLELRQGIAEVTFTSGVRGVFTAPASLTIESPSSIAMVKGTAWFEVPPGAEGFTVETPRLHVEDLGTEFGIISVPQATDEVHVITGKVVAKANAENRKSETLSAGESRKVNAKHELVAIPPDQSLFATSLSDRLSYLHFNFDSIEGDQVLTGGNHPAINSISNRLIQSDQRTAHDRLVPGRFGSAISFNGQGDIIQSTWTGVYGPAPLTIACWVKHERPSFGGLVAWGVGKHESEEPHQWKIVTPPKGSRKIGKALFRCAWGQTVEQHVPIDPPDGEWHHFAVVYTGGSPESGTERLFFYVDGREVKQDAPEVPTPPRRPPDFLDATPLTFGARLSEDVPRHGKFFQGALDEVFIIEGALTAEQIQILYEKNTYMPAK